MENGIEKLEDGINITFNVFNLVNISLKHQWYGLCSFPFPYQSFRFNSLVKN